MNRLKLILALSLSALFLAACSGSDTQPAANNSAASSSSNANASSNTAAAVQPAAAPMPNANQAPKETAKAATEDKKKEESKPEPIKTKVDAAALYAANKCAGCHGADGKGNPKIKDAPDFTNAAWQKKQSDGELTAAIKNGKKPIMPAFGEKLTEAEIKALVAYVRAFAKK